MASSKLNHLMQAVTFLSLLAIGHITTNAASSYSWRDRDIHDINTQELCNENIMVFICTANSGLPVCEHGHKSLCGCQTLDVFDTVCHRVHSKSLLGGLPGPWQLPFLCRRNPAILMKVSIVKCPVK